MKSDISLAVNAGHDSLSPIDAKYRVRANEWNAVRSKCFAPMPRQVHVTSLCVLKIILGRHDRTYVRLPFITFEEEEEDLSLFIQLSLTSTQDESPDR